MIGPSLQKSAAASAALHLTFLLIWSFILQRSGMIVAPSPYVVSLVGSSALSSGKAAVREDSIEEAGADVSGTPAETTFERGRVESRIKDLERRSDRLSEIEQKKKIERIVRLRKVISVGGHEEAKAAGMRGGQAAGGHGGVPADSYYAQITRQIRSEWAFPDTGDRNLEAIVAISIMKDGTMTVRALEKSSGNALFDRSALRAIAKASPVSPPPYEMEIGIRFYP